MKKILTLIFFGSIYISNQAQVLVEGNILLNNVRAFNSTVTVLEKGTVVHKIKTESKSTFAFEVEFGPDFVVYIENPDAYKTFFTLETSKIPKKNYDDTYKWEMDAGLVSKKAANVDTSVFSSPFYKVVFSGSRRHGMAYDTAYVEKFEKSIYKAPPAAAQDSLIAKSPSTIAGRIFVKPETNLSLNNKKVYALNKDGKVISTAMTNKFGNFLFLNVIPSDVVRMEVDVEDVSFNGVNLSIFNDKNQAIAVSSVKNGKCDWNMDSDLSTLLVDNNYSGNIAGKLIVSSSKIKEFFANKSVYLSDNENHLLSTTKTNSAGLFVFEDIKPVKDYFIGVDKKELKPGERIDILNRQDKFIATLDSSMKQRFALKYIPGEKNTFEDLAIDDAELKMDVKATIFGDDVNHPIGKFKILLLNDAYQIIDSTLTDDFGTFKFKYLPFLKRFYLSAGDNDNILDVFKNILIYSSDAKLIKIMTHQKGTKFLYKAVHTELAKIREIEFDEPTLKLTSSTKKETKPEEKPEAKIEKAKGTEKLDVAKKNASKSNNATHLMAEQVHFEFNHADLKPESKQVLDKVILILNESKKMVIEVGAFTDSKGSDEVNLVLSNLRAITVKKYITNAGIVESRVFAKGYGETKLLNNCGNDANCSEVQHAENRRVEFKILEE